MMMLPAMTDNGAGGFGLQLLLMTAKGAAFIAGLGLSCLSFWPRVLRCSRLRPN